MYNKNNKLKCDPRLSIHTVPYIYNCVSQFEMEDKPRVHHAIQTIPPDARLSMGKGETLFARPNKWRGAELRTHISGRNLCAHANCAMCSCYMRLHVCVCAHMCMHLRKRKAFERVPYSHMSSGTKIVEPRWGYHLPPHPDPNTLTVARMRTHRTVFVCVHRFRPPTFRLISCVWCARYARWPVRFWLWVCWKDAYDLCPLFKVRAVFEIMPNKIMFMESWLDKNGEKRRYIWTSWNINTICTRFRFSI